MSFPYVPDSPVEVRVSVAIDPETHDYVYEWFATTVIHDYADLLSPDAPIEVRDLDAVGKPFVRRVPRDDVRPSGQCPSVWHRVEHVIDETVVLCPACRLRSPSIYGAADSRAVQR